MKKRVLSLLLFACMLMCLAACGETQVEHSDADTAQEWTVLLYLCGTDLETEYGAATGNLDELLSAGIGNNVNYLIQTGGTEQWQNDVISPNALQRWKLMEDELTLVDEQELASMGDAETLAEFLRWGVETYPADRYMVVLWNHGGGSVTGVEFDELYENDSLDLNELAQGLSGAGVTFDIIGFDTCLMATLETAAAIAPYGKYMVASQEIEPGGGWDYTTWAGYMEENPDEATLEIGKVICDSYYAKCVAEGSDDIATLSITDLSQVGAVVTAFDEMAHEMTGISSDIDSFRGLIQGATRAENYGGNNDEEGYTCMVDLGNLVTQTEGVLTETAQGVYEAVQDAVVYQVYGSARTAGNGLSIFFPLSFDDDMLDSYANIATSGAYLRFLEACTGWTASDEAVLLAAQWAAGFGDGTVEEAPAAVANNVYVQKDTYEITLSNYIDDDGTFTLQVESGMETVNMVEFVLYFFHEEEEEYLLLGTDNDIAGDWDEGEFQDNFRGVWPAIDGVYVSMFLLAEEDEYNLYTIPVLLNGEESNLRAMWIWDDDENGHYEVIGTWDGVDGETGASARDIHLLREGDELTFLAHLFSADGEDTAIGILGTIEVGPGGEVLMEEMELMDGLYEYSFQVTDVFGEVHDSDTVTMECSEGELYIYELE